MFIPCGESGARFDIVARQSLTVHYGELPGRWDYGSRVKLTKALSEADASGGKVDHKTGIFAPAHRLIQTKRGTQVEDFSGYEPGERG